MSFIAIILLCISFGDIAWLLISWRLTRGWPWLRFATMAFLVAELALLLSILASRIFHFAVPLPRPVLSAAYLWHLCAMPLLSLAWLVWEVVVFARLLPKRKSVSAGTAGVTRRGFLATSLAAAPAVFTVGGAAVAEVQLEDFRVRRLTVALPELPPALDGLTIAQVSDLHVGRFTSGSVLRAVIDATNALRADLVVLTGDLINYDLGDLPAGLDLVRTLRAAHGVFMCEGNHDLLESPREFWKRTREAGVNLLVNETRSIEVRGVPVQILGLAWAHGDDELAARLRLLLARRDASAFPILLAHHPHAFDFAGDLPLTLAGHTHGGQLMLTENFGAGPAMFRYWSGLYRRAGRALVVSNGVGNWFPLRTRAPAEIVHLTLRRTA